MTPTNLTAPGNLAGMSKKEIHVAAARLAEGFTTAAAEPVLPAYVFARKLAEFSDGLAKALAPAALAERQSDAAKISTTLGAKVEVAEAGVSYDYTADLEWQQLKAAEGAAGAARKEREALLLALKGPLDTLDPATGEVRTLCPPVRRSTTSLKITL